MADPGASFTPRAGGWGAERGFLQPPSLLGIHSRRTSAKTWASPMNSTILLVFSAFVLIATGFVATWRVKRSPGARVSKPALRAPARRPVPPADAAKREPFMAAAKERQEPAARPALPPRVPRAQAPASTPPAGSAGTGASDALYIGSVNLNPAPSRRTPPAGAGAKRPAIESRTTQALAEDFMQWLREGMAARTLQINTLQSALHFTDTAMVLVYPAIFQAYAGACDAPALKGPAAQAARTQTVLNAVCSQGWHESGPFDSRLLHFELLQHRAEPAIFRGVVILSPQRFINPLPPPNPALSRLI